MSIWIYSYEVVDVFLFFVVNLLIVNGCFVFDCLDMLVWNFLFFLCGFFLFFDLFSRIGLMMGIIIMDKLKF